MSGWRDSYPFFVGRRMEIFTELKDYKEYMFEEFDKDKGALQYSGVYLLGNKRNGKILIGSTSSKKGIRGRIRRHKRKLNNKKHKNNDLLSDWHEFGIDSFYVAILHECDDLVARKIEHEYIEEYMPSGMLYNKMCPCLVSCDRKTYRKIMEKIIRTSSGCYEYTGCTKHGYGRCWCGNKLSAVHRLIYAYHYGSFPPYMYIRHMCNNKPCVNPIHLKVGTPLDNARDEIESGRSNRHGSRSVAPSDGSGMSRSAIGSYNFWSDEMKQWVEQNAGRLYDKEATCQLNEIFERNVTVAAYRRKRVELGFIKKSGRGLCKLKE